MALHTEDMSKVPAPDDLVPEGWYHVRVKSVKEELSKSNGEPTVYLQLAIQDESQLGRQILDSCSLQSHALFKLKGYYKAVGYVPGPEGHDPDMLLDRECYVYAQHQVYQGNNRVNIPPYSIRSVQDGPGKSVPKKKEQAA